MAVTRSMIGLGVFLQPTSLGAIGSATIIGRGIAALATGLIVACIG